MINVHKRLVHKRPLLTANYQTIKYTGNSHYLIDVQLRCARLFNYLFCSKAILGLYIYTAAFTTLTGTCQIERSGACQACLFSSRAGVTCYGLLPVIHTAILLANPSYYTLI